MRNWVILVIIIGVFMTSAAVRGDEKRTMNPEVLLPSEAAGWKWDGKGVTFDSKALFDYIDGAAELYLAYGFQNLTVRRFEKSDQPPITLELYEMASSEDAYGVFSFERQDEDIGIGQGSEFGGGLLRFWKGKYFISIYADGEGADVESTLFKLGKATANAISSNDLEPRLIRFIPGKDLGLIDRSVRFLRSHILLNQRFFISHQNILSLNRQTEAVLAQYMSDKQKVHLLLVRYPSVKGATEAYQGFMKAYLPDAGTKGRSKTEDQKWTVVRQRDEFLVIVFGAPVDTDAEILIRTTERSLGR